MFIRYQIDKTLMKIIKASVDHILDIKKKPGFMNGNLHWERNGLKYTVNVEKVK